MSAVTHPELITSFIDGAFVPVPKGGHRLDIINPSTEDRLAELCEADAQEVDRAVQAADTAFQQARWHGLPVEQRAAVLRRVADLTEKYSAEL